MSPAEKKRQERDIDKALKQFPKAVARQAKRHKERQKFLKETFGDLVKQVRSEVGRLKK